MKKLIFLAGLSIFTVLIAQASINKEKLFPSVEGWERQIYEKEHNRDNLWNIINGAADEYLTYGFQKLYRAEYTTASGNVITVYAYEQEDLTNTFGIYAQHRASDYTYLDIGLQGYRSAEALYFITGNYYIQLKAKTENKEELEKLARTIDQSIGIEESLPHGITLLPEEGKQAYSESYIPNNFLGYSFLHSAFTATYNTEEGSDSFEIFIIKLANDQEVDQMIQKYLDFVKYNGDIEGKSQFIVSDKYNGKVMIGSKEQYVYGIVSGNDAIFSKYIPKIQGNLP